MTNKFAVFKKYPNLDQANELGAALKQNGIEYKYVNNSPQLDITFTGNTLQDEVQVLILQSDFDKANKLLESQAEELIEQIDTEHYLFEFTNEELFEILMKPDEWSAFDYKLSQKILKDRGETVNEGLINTLRKQRIEDLAKPEQGQKPWIYTGYLFAILGGILGIIIGWYLWNYKKTLPNGQKVYAYSESDQKHGRNIFYIGLLGIVFWVSFRMVLEYKN